MQIWIIRAMFVLLMTTVPMWAESEKHTNSENLSGRSKFETATPNFGISACYAGRNFLDSLVNRAPSVNRSGKDPKVQRCLDELPLQKKWSDIPGRPCISSIGSCEAQTMDGGKTPIRPPLHVEFACIYFTDPIKLKKEACERGIDPKRLADSDIHCTGSAHLFTDSKR